MSNSQAFITDRPFSDASAEFLSCLSARIFQEGKHKSELYPVAFFCRKSNLLKLRVKYGPAALPCGVALFICPKNVDALGCWALVFGILSGNYTVVRPRIPSGVFEEFVELAQETDWRCGTGIFERVCLIGSADDEPLQYWSRSAQVRVCWGGNESIAKYASFPVPAECRNVYFGHRNSLSVIDCAAVRLDVQTAAEEFFRCAYTGRQASCSSPRAVYFLHYDRDTVADFWARVGALAQKIAWTPADIAEKYAELCACLARYPLKVTAYGNCLYVLEGEAFRWTENPPKGFGTFFSFPADTLGVCIEGLDQIQTISYYGADPKEIFGAVLRSGNLTVSRIVELKDVLDFGATADGVDIFSALLRFVRL